MKLLRVEVVNFLANANTTFDKETNVETISYKPWQFSESKYNMAAKGVKDSECVPLDEEDIPPVISKILTNTLGLLNT